jgi:hypothetical protein
VKPFGLSPKQFSLIPALALTVSTAVDAGRADALLVFEFTQQGGDVQLDVSGSLTGLPTNLGTQTAGDFGSYIRASSAQILLGSLTSAPFYPISAGPLNFGAGDLIFLDTGAYTGADVFLEASGLTLPSTYVEGNTITGTALFAGTTLSDLGLSSTTPGALLGTWTIGSDSIEVRIGGGGGAAVPGPLPLFGAAAAFAHSRRLRARVRAGSSSQA